MVCNRCGYTIPDGAEKCPTCAAVVAPGAAQSAQGPTGQYAPPVGNAPGQAGASPVPPNNVWAPPQGQPPAPAPQPQQQQAGGYTVTPVGGPAMPTPPQPAPPEPSPPVQYRAVPPSSWQPPPPPAQPAQGTGQAGPTQGTSSYTAPQPTQNAYPYQPVPAAGGGAPPPYGAGPQAAPAGKGGFGRMVREKRKLLIIIAIIVVAAIACAVFIPLGIHSARQTRYNNAVTLLEGGQYQQAADEFVALGEFDDSAEMAAYCEDAMDYDAARKLMESGDYEGAIEMFAALGSFKDTLTLKTECENTLGYQAAAALLAAGDYPAAQAAFEQLGDFNDSPAQATFCRNKISYAAAQESMAQGLYYTAWKAFDSLGGFEDAAAQRDACVQPFPATGETFHDGNFVSSATSLIVNPPTGDGSFNYLKIYTQDGTLVSCLAIAPGASGRVDLPPGVYRIKAAYAYGDWFGDTEMFGDDGRYQVLTFDDAGTDTFEFVNNHEYTLSLRSAGADTQGDDVNTYSEDRGEF